MAQGRDASFGTLTGAAKLEKVTKLVNDLSEDLETGSLTSAQRKAALEELKIYGRDSRDAEPIFTKKVMQLVPASSTPDGESLLTLAHQGVTTLAQHGLHDRPTGAGDDGLRCLANAMLLKPTTRQLLVDLGVEAELCSRLKNASLEDEFVVSRIIFYTTYQTSINLVALIERHHLAEYMAENLSRHAERLKGRRSSASIIPMEDMALAETLKLLYNLSHFCPQQTEAFTPSLPHLVTLLCEREIPTTKPLDPPLGPLVNAFINLDLDSTDATSALHPEGKANMFEDKILQILEAATRAYTDSELEETVTPVIAVIDKVLGSALSGAREVLLSKLLPTEDDRQQVLGRSASLPSWLLKNSTNPSAPALRKAIASLLYDLSDKDASKLVQNVGYGYASGILFQNNIPIPADFGAQSDSTGARPVNPITGQFIDLESHTEAPPMTPEEQEREAERLFVLFERLRRTGVINVQNPVEAAVQQGRFEELDDDSAEEVD